MAVVAALAFWTSSGGAAEPTVLQLELVTAASSPVYVTAPPGDTTRVFIVQQGSSGQAVIRLWKNDTLSDFMTVTGISAGGERGLLSMAFSPDYASSGLFYVYYTEVGSGDMVVAEFRRDALNPDIGDPSSRRIVIDIVHGPFSNHNGGQLQFGPDGYLYLGTGDGGGGGDPFLAGQNLEDLRGKLLRIDPTPQPPDVGYSIPPDNPFCCAQVAGRDEIWAYGLRNPWRFSFDRQTGDLALADVGQNAWEELDFAPAPNAGRGVNFGWSCMEGRHLFGNCPEPPNHTRPVWEYPHPTGCSVTGGYVVRDPGLPSLLGKYVYTDYCASGSASFGLRSIQLALPDALNDQSLGLTQNAVTTFGEDAQGRVYVAGGGQVSRFVETGPPPPPPPPPPAPPPPPPAPPPPPPPPAPPPPPPPPAPPPPPPAPPPPAPPPPPPPAPPPPPPAPTGVCRVPKLRGLTLRVARARIRRGGCVVGTVRYLRSRAVRRNRVLYQGPRGGIVRPRGTRVSVILAR